MQNKKRKVYDNDNIVLEVAEEVKIDESVASQPATADEKDTILMTTEQAFDVLAGYSLPRLEMVEQGIGECIICGIETNSPMRCVCFDCMKKHGAGIYRKAKEATAKSKKTFVI